jgi:hypothetical protein
MASRKRFSAARVFPSPGLDDAEEVVDGGARGIEPQGFRQLAPRRGAVGGLKVLEGSRQDLRKRSGSRLHRQQEEERQNHAGTILRWTCVPAGPSS